MTNNASPSLAQDVDRHIRAALDAGGRHDSDRIVVDVDGDSVILKGAVPSWVEHEDAEAAALSVPGVRKVDNQLALLIKGRLVK